MAALVPRPARRDLTAREQRRLVAMRKRLDAADRLLAERDRLIIDVYHAGGNVLQIADELGVTKETIYLVLRRSRS